MKHQATRDLYAYWNALRRGRSAPDRSEIEPTAIRDVLADTFMLDIDQSHAFPIRLAGTRFNGLFDAEQKGRSFLELWRAEERRNVAAVLTTVVDGACPVVAGGVAAPAGQLEAGSFEFLFLPLRHHGKTHARLLGIATPAASREPAWLGLLPLGPMALRSPAHRRRSRARRLCAGAAQDRGGPEPRAGLRRHAGADGFVAVRQRALDAGAPGAAAHPGRPAALAARRCRGRLTRNADGMPSYPHRSRPMIRPLSNVRQGDRDRPNPAGSRPPSRRRPAPSSPG